MSHHPLDSRSIPFSPLCSGQTASEPPQDTPTASLRRSPELSPRPEAPTLEEHETLRGVPEEVLEEAALRIARLAVRYYQHLKEKTNG